MNCYVGSINSAKPDKSTSEEKFRMVLETASMTEAELSAYCRKHGIYPEQIEAWKQACMGANAESEAQTKQYSLALQLKRTSVG